MPPAACPSPSVSRPVAASSGRAASGPITAATASAACNPAALLTASMIGGAMAPPKKPAKVWKEKARPIRAGSITDERMA